MSPQTQYKGLIAAPPRGHEDGRKKPEQQVKGTVDRRQREGSKEVKEAVQTLINHASCDKLQWIMASVRNKI